MWFNFVYLQISHVLFCFVLLGYIILLNHMCGHTHVLHMFHVCVLHGLPARLRSHTETGEGQEQLRGSECCCPVVFGALLLVIIVQHAPKRAGREVASTCFYVTDNTPGRPTDVNASSSSGHPAARPTP